MGFLFSRVISHLKYFMSQLDRNINKARNRQMVLPTAFLFVYIAVSFAGWWIFGEAVMLVSLLVLLAMVLVFQLAIYIRVQYNSSLFDQNYRQIEALFSVYSFLNLKYPLPPMRGWSISPDVAANIISLIQEKRPQTIVDIGSGVSTLVSGYCLRRIGSGRVFGVDHEDKFAEQTKQSIGRHEIKDFAQVIYAPLKPVLVNGKKFVWYDTEVFQKTISSIDMLIVDGPPEKIQPLSRYPALPLMWNKLSDDAVVIVDDAFNPDIKKMIEMWRQEYPKLNCEIISTEKGMAIFRRNSEK